MSDRTSFYRLMLNSDRDHYRATHLFYYLISKTRLNIAYNRSFRRNAQRRCNAMRENMNIYLTRPDAARQIFNRKDV
ncbi:hypothetical protein PUN28_011751 [Cardiocondyla obscurior]|uniref:Uncharacterized protein n=1 Tax=Cardiocondyla obscurior TaxID=286306 RepID=A0AAW2FHV4_9HYME